MRKVLPNGVRLSCGATLEGSQTQFYRRRRALSASHVTQRAVGCQPSRS